MNVIKYAKNHEELAAYSIGGIAAFWLIERVVGF